jgi:hypothetical protein
VERERKREKKSFHSVYIRVFGVSATWTSHNTRREHTEESDTAFRMKTLNSDSPQFHSVSGEWQVHHNGPPPSTRYKTGGPAASNMDRSMLRQAGTRRTL